MDISFITPVNIGESISNRLDEIGIPKVKFAREVDVDQSNLNKFLRKKTINTGKLVLISRILKYNFFKDYCPDCKDEQLRDESFFIREVNVGDEISKELKWQGISHKDLVLKIRSNENAFKAIQSDISKIVKSETIDTGKLVDISIAIGYNFFYEYCISEEEAAIHNLGRIHHGKVFQEKVYNSLSELLNAAKNTEADDMGGGDQGVAELLKRIEQLTIENYNLHNEIVTLKQKLAEAGISI